MNMAMTKKKAEKLGIRPGKMRKVDLVREIQIKEGNAPCYLTANDSCQQNDCCWRDDCLAS